MSPIVCVQYRSPLLTCLFISQKLIIPTPFKQKKGRKNLRFPSFLIILLLNKLIMKPSQLLTILNEMEAAQNS